MMYEVCSRKHTSLVLKFTRLSSQPANCVISLIEIRLYNFIGINFLLKKVTLYYFAHEYDLT